MIDEYQDSNLIQELILTSVSGVSRGDNNLFMVGDVKQSIYRFRLARPELFMEKYDSYPTEAGGITRRIDLHRNFRSRREVLDGVNYIFERIMRKKIGGIRYDEDARLNYGASYEETKDCEMELIGVDCDSREAEARAVAMRIREMVGTFQVTDGEIRRPCTYGDIAVLFRSVSGWTDVFRDVFEEEGIPAYVGSRTGYFQAKEIQLMLQYLKLLDNPRQDFPLTAVLTSPLADFTANELAQIRLLDEKKSFYLCARNYCAEGTDEIIKKKLNNFYSKYNQLRDEAKWRPLHELISRIVQETGFDAWMAARPDGAQKEANIAMLIQQAVRFESTSYKGVFHFVRYMDQLESYEIDYGEAETSAETDAVQFMSIHKSKGLEFPVVILAGMGKKFNETDLNEKILLHPDAGIGMQAIDLKLRVKLPSAVRSYIRQRMKIDNLGEEIRVLYVALTRAKEKMIMAGRYQPQKNDDFYPQGILPGFDKLLNASSYMELMKLIVQSAKSENELPFTIRMLGEEDIQEQQIGEAVSDYDRLQKVKNSLIILENDGSEPEEDFRDLDEQFSYQYPHANLQNYKMKFTVSELKKQQDVLEDGSMLFAEEEVVPLLPKFLSDEETITGAGRGSIYHKVMELLDYTKEYNEDIISKEIKRFTNEGYLTEEMANCVNHTDILQFLESESGQRMQKAARHKKLYKEQPFVLGIPSSHIYGESAEDEMTLVQGIIDVFFEEEDGIVVLDYKTDRVRYGMDLKNKYEKQLDYYAEALERMLHRPVKEKIIYSFTLQEEIKW
jgi:ATP-dependent helicase/nuclease subunit A